MLNLNYISIVQQKNMNYNKLWHTNLKIQTNNYYKMFKKITRNKFDHEVLLVARNTNLFATSSIPIVKVIIFLLQNYV